MPRSVLFLALGLFLTFSDVKGQSKFLDFTGCPNAIITAANGCLDGRVFANGTLDTTLANQLTNSSLSTMCATGGCLANLRNATRNANGACQKLMAPIRHICTATKTPSGTKYCAADLPSVVARLLQNRVDSSGNVTFTSANPTQNEFDQLCNTAVNPCFARSVQIIKSVIRDPKTSVLAPLPVFGDAFCLKMDTNFCFDSVRTTFTQVNAQNMTSSINTLKSSIGDLATFCRSSSGCNRFALGVVNKGQERQWKANKENGRSDNGTPNSVSSQVNTFEMFKYWMATACQNTTLANGTVVLVGSITKDDFITYVLNRANSAATRRLESEDSKRPTRSQSSSPPTPPPPPSKGQPSDKMPPSVRAGCALLNNTIAALGCGALPIMNFRMMLAKNNIRIPANAAKPILANNFTATEGLLRAMENPQAVCGVASGAGCSNGTAQPQVTTAVPLPGLDCSQLTANQTAMQSICDLMSGVKTALLDAGSIDDPTQMTAASLCSITLDTCQATAALNATNTTVVRRLQTSNDNTLSLSVAAPDATTATLLTLQMSAGVTSDAVVTSMQSLTGTSAALISSTTVDPTVSSDPSTSVSSNTYTAPTAGTAVDTAPTTTDVAAGTTLSTGTYATKTTSQARANKGGLVWIALAALVFVVQA